MLQLTGELRMLCVAIIYPADSNWEIIAVSENITW